MFGTCDAEERYWVGLRARDGVRDTGIGEDVGQRDSCEGIGDLIVQENAYALCQRQSCIVLLLILVSCQT
jgi:hypothetical protein